MSSNSIFGNNPANISAQKFFIPQLLPQEVPASGSTLPPFGWFTLWANPTLKPVDEHAEPSLFWAPSGMPFQNPPIGWDVSWPNPTLPRPTTYSDPSLFWTPTNAPIQNPPIGWDEPWSNPTLAAFAPNVGSVAWEPQAFSQVVISPPYGWFMAWENPHVASSARGESLFWMPTNAPIQNPSYGWYASWSQPKTSVVTQTGSISIVFRPIAAPPRVTSFVVWIADDFG